MTPQKPELSKATAFLALGIIGLGWAGTMPLTKIAVSTGHGQLGLIFWQLLIATCVLGAVMVATGRALPKGRGILVTAVVIALTGTIIPNTASYTAYRALPAGVMSILMATVPMAAFAIALPLGVERFTWRRFGGVCLGLIGVILIAAPETSLPEAAMYAMIPIALIAPMMYGLESNYVARWGTSGMDPVQTLFLASALGTCLVFPLAVGSGQFISPIRPLGAPEGALFMLALLHAGSYTGYVWLVGRAGAVFSSQVAYVVTAFGVLFSMLFLGETYAMTVWVALVVMVGGLALISPKSPTKRQESLA